MNMLRRVGAYIVLLSVYSLTALVAVLSGMVPRRRWKPTGRILVTGTFHNPNWYLSHVVPLTRSGVREVILVSDEAQLQLEGVRFVCPPKWALMLFTRAGAKAFWMFFAGLYYRPDLYMGYHLAPGACTALVVGKLLGRPACYQMTGGPAGIIGGGYGAIDSVEGALGRPSRLIEAAALRVVRQFELVVVRGRKAKEFLAGYGIRQSVVAITGSVSDERRPAEGPRDFDLIFVGRLSPVKQVDQFIQIIHSLRRILPGVRAAVVGDGPLMATLQHEARELGLNGSVQFLGKRKDVEALLSHAKIFVLTSKSEGLSIAMAEAMAIGVVPVVANVGELGDLVQNGVNGYLVEPNKIDEYVQRAAFLLQDEAVWARCSREAVEAARTCCSLDAVTEKWRRCIRDVVAQASGCDTYGDG